MFNSLKLLMLIFNKKSQNEVGRFLIENHLTLSVAESCTGGLLSSLLTDVSGSSVYTNCNFITYANEAKMKYLSVEEETLNSFGAVSEQTARAMVQGLLDNTGSDISIATTGIAGPTGGTLEKPVGLIYIGIGMADNITVYKYNTCPKLPRVLIKYMFVKQALKFLMNFLKEHKQ